MLSEPGAYLEKIREEGAYLITIHVEAVSDPGPLLDRIHELGAGAGLALNPPTPIESVAPYLDRCDLVLAMSVMPGFGGQKFQTHVLDKIRWLRDQANEDLLVSVDGGVNLDTIRPCAEAGANLFVTGTALLGQDDYGQRLAELTALATCD